MHKIFIISSIFFSITSANAAPDKIEMFLKEQGIAISEKNDLQQSINHNDKKGSNLDPLGSFVASKLGLRKTTESLENKLVTVAKTFLGVPYKFGGNTEDGLDCSALVKLVYEKAAGVVLPRVTKEQASSTKKIAQKDLKPGDLVFFNTMKRKYSHVGIYVGNDNFIHAPRSGANVRLENMNKSYWTSRFNGAHRVDPTMLE